MLFTRGNGNPVASGRYLAPPPDDEDFPPMGFVRRLLRESGLALVIAGLIVLLFVAYQLLGTTLTEQHNQTQLQKQFNQAVVAQAANPSSPAKVARQVASGGSDTPTVGGIYGGGGTGRALDHLVIPAIGVDKYVVQGVSQSDLSKGPGHYPETVLPGQKGNAAIAGHRTTYGAPFFGLNNLKTGDRIIITDTSDHRFTYYVRTIKVVPPTDVAVLNPTRTARLTLTTCNPRFSLTNRLVVVATLTKPTTHVATKKSPASTKVASTTTVTTTTPGTTTATTVTTTTPTTVAAAAPPAQLASAADLGEGDTAARTPTLLYGALVPVLWVLTRVGIHRTRRWKRTLVSVAGVAVCLIALWFFFENVVRLLPPNI